MNNHILVNPQRKPKNTVLYVSANLYDLLKRKEYLTEDLYNKLLQINNEIPYETFLLALNFLFLLNRINFNENEELVCT